MIKKLSIVSALILGLSTSALANEGRGMGNGPCKKILAACESAGFVKGGHKDGNKGIYKDCLQPILAGQQVAGVTVDAADIQACQVKKEKRKARRADKQAKEKK